MFRSTHSLFVSQFSRRSVLKGAAAAGAVAVASPAIVSQRALLLGLAQHHQLGRRIAEPADPQFREGDRHQGQFDAVQPERGADQQAAGDRRRRLRRLPADARPRAAVQGHRRPAADRHRQMRPDQRHRAGPAVGLDQELDLGRQALSRAACLGHGGDLLAQRPHQDRPGGTVVRHAVERRIQGQGAGPPAFAAARHRPVDGRDRQAADQPHARRLQGRGDDEEDLRRSSSRSPSPTSPGSSSSGTAPTTPSPASRPTAS